MTDAAPELYQGSDWLTYRWPVAQMFDTLDRMRDLCHSAANPGVEPRVMSAPSALFDPAEEKIPEPFLCIAELCCDLTADLDAVLADLFPYLQNNAAHRWAGFEIRLHINAIREAAAAEHKVIIEKNRPENHAVDIITALSSRIRDLLRSIDQH